MFKLARWLPLDQLKLEPMNNFLYFSVFLSTEMGGDSCVKSVINPTVRPIKSALNVYMQIIEWILGLENSLDIPKMGTTHVYNY